MIERETENAKAGKDATIFGKVNSLVDTETIQALYLASQAGVRIRLLIRGICCLRAQVPGVSENIAVRSLVGRFLEHSRIFRFENAGKPVIYLSSADWMPRNFFRRVETCFPIQEQALKAQIEQMLDLYWQDNVKAREQAPDELTYRRRPIEGDRIDAQALFVDQVSKRKHVDIEAKPVVVKVPIKREVPAEIGPLT
jgi:polyphosphate kinase